MATTEPSRWRDTRSIDSSRSIVPYGIPDRLSIESIDRSSPKGSPIDFRSSRSIDRALWDPRSTFDRVDRSIEPYGIPDRSIRVDRALRDPRSIDSSRSSRSSPMGSPIDFRSSRSIDRALRDPRSTFDRVDRSSDRALWDPRSTFDRVDRSIEP